MWIMCRFSVLLCLIVALNATAASQDGPASSAFSIARLKYAGGGDWYNDPSEEVNLLLYVHRQTGIPVDARYHCFVEADWTGPHVHDATLDEDAQLRRAFDGVFLELRRDDDV